MLTSAWLHVALVVFRICWSLLPQTGYIFPDEFFQTVEVVAGDALDVSVERTWEFNKTFPLRSILIPKLLFHPPFRLLQMLASEGSGGFRITGWHMICAPRLVITLVSVGLDFSLFHMCKDLGVSSQRGLVILASSYVTLTYLTHTFSNSIETLLLAVVVLLIIKSRNCDSKEEKQSECEESKSKNFSKEDEPVSDTDSGVLNDSDGMSNRSHSTAFDIRRRKCKLLEETHPFMDEPDMDTPYTQTVNSSERFQRSTHGILACVLLAILNTVGIFNRPTFVLFSCLPFMWWLSLSYRDIYSLMFKMAIFICVSMATAVVFCVADTVYYHNLSLDDIADLDQFLPNFVFTPLNFIMYNIKDESLVQHGRHPFYLHFLVNMPLLFGPLTFYVYKGLFRAFKICLWFEKPEADFEGSNMLKIKQKSKSTIDNNSRAISHILLLGFVCAPVLLLSVFQHQEARYIVPVLPLLILYVVYSTDKLPIPFWSMFCIFNLTLSVLYGVCHQGGVIPCILKLPDLTHSQKIGSSFHIIFSHTYMPPLHPMMIEKDSNVHIHDLKGSSFSKVHDLIFHLKMSEMSHSLSMSSTILIVMPGSLVEEFMQKYSGIIRLKTVEMFFPHLSLEDPPVIRSDTCWAIIRNRLSLFLMEVEDL